MSKETEEEFIKALIRRLGGFEESFHIDKIVEWSRDQGFFIGKFRPAEEYHEDDGNALWIKHPVDEPPYVGTSNDLGYQIDEDSYVGGWTPDYYTHFAEIPNSWFENLPTPPREGE